MYIYIYVPTYIHTYIYIYMHIYAYIYMCMYVCMYIHIRTYVHTCIPTYIHICSYVYISILFISIHFSIYPYTHTYVMVCSCLFVCEHERVNPRTAYARRCCWGATGRYTYIHAYIYNVYNYPSIHPSIHTYQVLRGRDGPTLWSARLPVSALTGARVIGLPLYP